jgi:very-short-patch-repair endonuclease
MAFGGMKMAKRRVIFVSRLKRQVTQAERRFCCRLHELGLIYRFQQGFYHPYYRIVDFYLPDHNLIVEIDGPCHDPEKDRRRDEWFTRVRGIRIIRLRNEQVLSGDFELPPTQYVPTIQETSELCETSETCFQ